MKYFVDHKMEWNYDDLEIDEIRIFKGPDNFKFDVDLIRNFLLFKGLESCVDERYNWEVRGYFKNKKQDYKLYSINWLMNKNSYCVLHDIKKGEFIEYLKMLGIEEIQFEEII